MSTDERLLLAVSAASPVTSDGDRSYCHQKDDHHVVVQHRLIGCIHGNQSSCAKGLQELKTALSQVKAKDFPIKHAIIYIQQRSPLYFFLATVCSEIHRHLPLQSECKILIYSGEFSGSEKRPQYDPSGSHRLVRLCQ